MAAQVSFPDPQSVGEREWGQELLLCCAPKKYSVKLIIMNKGAKGGLQKHHQKDEAGLVTAGKMRVTFDNGNGLECRLCGCGDVFHFPPGAVHQIEALEHSSYIECSTPHFNDRVHVEHEYGIEEEAGGLPSTRAEEVELR